MKDLIMKEIKMDESQRKLFKTALLLSIATILISLLEGIASVYFGYKDETLTLFGFGIDSFIEMISGLGVYVMIKRIVNNPMNDRSKFEITSLRITGAGFYILIVGLASGIIVNLYNGNQPKTTIAGVIISLISISIMLVLINRKLTVGKKLNSSPIISDANCTKVCVYMSVVVLIASALFELFGLKYIDSIGALGIIYFSFKEGREAFEKAKGLKTCNCNDEHN
jgi:divalent metal cation (Fe/Co/Zn/Cd) transporter